MAKRFLLSVMLAAALCGIASAQAVSQISGTTIDQSGAVGSFQ
jgi:hypothetical protein